MSHPIHLFFADVDIATVLIEDKIGHPVVLRVIWNAPVVHPAEWKYEEFPRPESRWRERQRPNLERRQS